MWLLEPAGPGARLVQPLTWRHRSGRGTGCAVCLGQARAEHAATLLLHSDQPVTCIGQSVGWPDQNYFARRFRAHYGLSATTYRARFATSAVHLAPNRPGGLSLEIGSRPGEDGRARGAAS